jgi:RNA polymerase-interacting CarD/CdnL/TRCF family regulator
MKFRIGEQVGTSHGPGRIAGIERREINGDKVELYAVDLAKSRLLVPIDRAGALRPLSTLAMIADGMTVLGTRPKPHRGKWFATAIKFEQKIYSGTLPHSCFRCS